MSPSELFERIRALYPLSNLKLTPKSYLDNPWYLVASAGFSACNSPEVVPRVYEHARASILALKGDFPASEVDDAIFLLAQKMKDAIIGVVAFLGVHRAINALLALNNVLPEPLRQLPKTRDTSQPVENMAIAGHDLFMHTYGDTADRTRALIFSLHPDLGFYIETVAYGFCAAYGFMRPLEYSFSGIAVLISSDTPVQTAWHMQGALRHGSTPSQLRAVRQMAIDVARAAGVVCRNEVPDVPEMEASNHGDTNLKEVTDEEALIACLPCESAPVAQG